MSIQFNDSYLLLKEMTSAQMKEASNQQQKQGPSYKAKNRFTQSSDEDKYTVQKIYSIKLRNKQKIKQKNKQKEETFQNFNTSLWSLQENIKYRQFLVDRPHLVKASKFQRKSLKVNLIMSKFIVTRSAEQCRSHHQKMIKHHKDIQSIANYIDKLVRLRDGVGNEKEKENENEKTVTVKLEVKEEEKEAEKEGEKEKAECQSEVKLENELKEERLEVRGAAAAYPQIKVQEPTVNPYIFWPPFFPPQMW